MVKKYLLDTCVCISMFRNQHGVREKITQLGIENCFISEITLAELFFGLAKGSDKQRLLGDIIRVSELFTVLPARPCYQKYGEVRYALERAGNKIDQFDLLIGATALSYGLVLATGNIKHFSRINDLTLENWMI
ncbi:MAG: PIN domain-containing protein [Muribaculaceae bacterium]|nr:PIN domain-containing protein [Muribaculaceae bacterium]